jgi:hypothetical protein
MNSLYYEAFPMDYIQLFRRIALLATILVLNACGGSSESARSSVAATPPAPVSACSGAVKELFTAMQGNYDGVPDPAFMQGAGAPLVVSQHYPVTISGQDCSLRFTGEKDVQYRFIYGDAGSPSQLTGFSATAIIKAPTSLSLSDQQYNISIPAKNNTIELERRVKAISGGDVSDGDLHLYSIPGSASFGGLHMKASSKR